MEESIFEYPSIFVFESSDKELRKRILEKNNKYLDSHRKSVLCAECSSEISEISDMVRYFHKSLHNECFRAAYRLERFMLENKEREYFDRIEQILS
mgnify:CR=1 FL=1